MLAKATVVSLFILLVWGNLVAGLKAGLACPDWPLCHGKLLPPLRWDIYVEFIHRVIGAATSILIVTLAYKRFRSYQTSLKIIPILEVVLLLIQIFLGGLVVLLKLPVDLTTIHFANAIIIFSITLYLAYFDGKINKPSFSFSGAGGLFFILSIVILVQAVLGAYVRHSEAGLACPDFPKCLGYWIPPSLSGAVLVHFGHRILAYTIFIIFLAIFLFSKINNKLEEANPNLLIALICIISQILLGILIVFSQLKYYVTALHLSIGLIILSMTLLTWFKYIKKSYI